MINVKNGALQTAIENAAVGETVMLTESITLTSRITISTIVTIDLNGYTIAGNINDAYGLLYVGTKGVLTIIDSSSGKTGHITNTASHAIGNYGSVVIYGGTIIGNYGLYNFYYSNDIYGKAVIHSGALKSYDNNSPAIANCGDLIVNGGDIESIDTTSILSVAGGNIRTLFVGAADYSPVKQITNVSGGYIDTLEVSEESTNAILVHGGTFKTAIDEKYLADGVKFAYDTSTNSYLASANPGFKVIATSSSRIRDLAINDGQLIFMRDIGRIAFDFKGKRDFYNQIVEIETEAERQKLVSPLNGYYFVIDTAVLWSYKNGWIQITEKPQEVIFIGVEFPALGQEGKLYANTTEGAEHISVWNDASGDYVVVADKTQWMTSEDVIALFN